MANRQQNKPKKKIYKKLRNHYKLVILNIDTFEERFALLLTPLNLIAAVGAISLSFILIVFALLAWTPLRTYLPGYADELMVKKMAVETATKSAELELALAQNQKFLNNFEAIITGQPLEDYVDTSMVPVKTSQQVERRRSVEDSLLRVEIEKEDLVNLNPDFNKSTTPTFIFFPPLKGSITDKYNPRKEHYGIDVVATKNTTIKSIDDGTVVLAAYTAETGYVIQIQHETDLISVYKHNSVLLKKEGESVRAGEAIAIIGETGEYSTGPHLHFEMWRNGISLNPENYISFE